MAHSGPDGTRVRRRPAASIRLVEQGTKRLGMALLGAAIPAVVAVLAVALQQVGTAGLGEWIATAWGTSVRHGAGIDWAFHVAALVGLAGTWLLGLSLVLDGYFRVE